MTPHNRLNDPTICIVCSRRADGFAVGKPEQLGWYCKDCGPDLAKEALAMVKKREFDAYELKAIEQVAAKLPPEDFNFPKEELPKFLQWMIHDFGDAIRAEIDSGRAPF